MVSPSISPSLVGEVIKVLCEGGHIYSVSGEAVDGTHKSVDKQGHKNQHDKVLLPGMAEFGSLGQCQIRDDIRDDTDAGNDR